MRQLHILFNSAKTWHLIVYWFLCFAPNLPELNLKLFWTSEQNNFRFSSGKFGAKHRNQQTNTCQVLAELNKIWSCLIFIKLYLISITLITQLKCKCCKTQLLIQLSMLLNCCIKHQHKKLRNKSTAITFLLVKKMQTLPFLLMVALKTDYKSNFYVYHVMGPSELST